MDIVTHAMTGLILASPLWPAFPLTAAGVVVGSVLPDIDALARLFGKRAFLRWHQTYTHSVPVVLVVGLLGWWMAPDWVRTAEPWALPAAVAAVLLHVAMDASNTLGTAVLAPFSRRRFCGEWVFFVDAVVLVAATVGTATVAVPLSRDEPVGGWVAAAYGGFLAGYWSLRAALRGRAGRLAPAGTASLVPSALMPWMFLGYRRAGDAVATYRLNAVTGVVTGERLRAVYDGRFAAALAALPEYQLMCGLSPAYHVTGATPATATITEVGGASKPAGRTPPTAVRVVCRDLRTRNFGGRFGQLEALVSADGSVRTEAFHV